MMFLERQWPFFLWPFPLPFPKLTEPRPVENVWRKKSIAHGVGPKNSHFVLGNVTSGSVIKALAWLVPDRPRAQYTILSYRASWRPNLEFEPSLIVDCNSIANQLYLHVSQPPATCWRPTKFTSVSSWRSRRHRPLGRRRGLMIKAHKH
jgi:hypothetical protein